MIESYCDACGDMYRVVVATGEAALAKAVDGLVCRCGSCGKVESVETAYGDEAVERTSDSRDFLHKFGIEPMNPDGSKFGAVKDVIRERAVVDEKCPKCDNKGLNFYTMQLRSVDEGQTVFYECPKCAHTFSQNN
jgi:DNA-directed RNA polymerase I subunit RPA12